MTDRPSDAELSHAVYGMTAPDEDGQEASLRSTIRDLHIALIKATSTATRWQKQAETLAERLATVEDRLAEVERSQHTDASDGPASPFDATSTSDDEVPTARARAEAARMLVALTLTPVLAPLVAELTAVRQMNGELIEQIGQLREERGWLTSEVEQAQARLVERDAADGWWPAALTGTRGAIVIVTSVAIVVAVLMGLGVTRLPFGH